MVIFNKNNMMISRGDTVDVYFSVPDYEPSSGDTFTFSVREVDENGNMGTTVVLTQAMSIVTDESSNVFARLQLTSTQTKTLTKEKYCYDIVFTNSTTKIALIYPAKFTVREMVNNE